MKAIDRHIKMFVGFMSILLKLYLIKIHVRITEIQEPQNIEVQYTTTLTQETDCSIFKKKLHSKFVDNKTFIIFEATHSLGLGLVKDWKTAV